MSRLLTATLGRIAILMCFTTLLAADQQQPDQNAKKTTTTTTKKKAATNPKKPATAATNTSDADKVKTDERMSTRGLTPPKQTDQDKNKTSKPDAKIDAAPDTTNPK